MTTQSPASEINTSNNETFTSEYDYVNPATTFDISMDVLLSVPLMISLYTTLVLG